MTSFSTFALVVLIISLILIAFAIANVVYYNQFKNGTSLTQNQLTGLVVINALAVIMLFIIFFYAIFAVMSSRSSGTKEEAVMEEGGEVLVPMTPQMVPQMVPQGIPVQQSLNTQMNKMNQNLLPTNVRFIGTNPSGDALFSVS